MRATQELTAEHRVIEQVLTALERVIAGAERSGVLPGAFVRNLVTFSRSFVDQCHHGKEERCFFPCLEKCGIPRDGGPIEMMLREHEQGRRLVGAIDETLTRHEDGRAALDELLALCREYVDFLRSHIEKETAVLFPMGDAVADADDDAATTECFAGAEAALGTRAYDTLTGLAASLCAAADTPDQRDK